MNVLLVVVDSLRAMALDDGRAGRPSTPFLDALHRRALSFRRANATECWTLPTHLSMFTGLLPSEHRAHFQSMAYDGAAPTLAEILGRAGFHTEVVTRNSLFDGTVPGATRGFVRNTRPLAELRGAATTPFALVLALAKPRVRRLLARSGFFTAFQRAQRDFVHVLARLGIPADALVLDHALEQMVALRRRRRPYFLFLNLYDVHAPYSPQPTSPLASFRSVRGWGENLSLPWVLPKISSHAYLRSGFSMSARSREMLRRRYHRAIELMDGKLAAFYAEADAAGLLDDTLLVLTSDHGEAFGEHELYLHDGSVWQTHLHVPLWIRHPDLGAGTVDDTVSTRDLFAAIRSVASGEGVSGTLLDPHARAARPVALAEHFHYPGEGLLAAYAQNIAAAVVGRRKVIVSREGLFAYDLERDRDELAPQETTIADFTASCRRDGVGRVALAEVEAHLRRWELTAAAA
jgi:arylsulfatase A-like enzyme